MDSLPNKVLVTGCGGFVGSFLAEFLLEMGFTVYGTIHQDSRNIDYLKEKLTTFKCDILDKDKIGSIVAEVNPDYVFHLAAQSLILPSWRDPEKTLKVNTLGTLNLLENIRKAAIDPVIEVVGSSAEYGFCDATESPIKESRKLRPSSPYGVSKVAEDMLAYIYWQRYGMKIIRVRPFYIVGPRKVSYVCSDFARGIVQIEAGQRDTLNVGNLDNVRDLVDVGDVVRAMLLIVTKGTPGEVYNISSGKGYRIKDILDKLISLSSQHIKVCTDPDRIRPSDEPILIGDSSRLRSLGWEPQISIEKTLSDILDYWRAKCLNG